jgi:hypothetical protein
MNGDLNAIPTWDKAAWEKIQAAKEAHANKVRDDVILAATKYASQALDAVQDNFNIESFILRTKNYPPMASIVSVLKERGFIVKINDDCNLEFDFTTYHKT